MGLGALGVAAALAGCGSTPAATPPPTTGSTGAATGAPSGTPSGGGSAATPLATTAEIPVGGGLILTDQQIVITQPTAGTFDAFTAVCTHAGNLVTSVANGTITCAHHGSTFNATTGQVTGGPASSALSSVPIKVKDGKIFAA